MPIIPSLEVVGNTGAGVLLHREVGIEKVGVIIGFTVKSNVAIESHPAAFVSDTGYVPADKYELLFQLYGKAVAHIVIEIVLTED